MEQLQTILLINDFNFINGGTSQVAILTANLLVERGFNVLFFSAVSDTSKTDLSANVRQYTTNQYDILKDPSRFRASLQGIWNKKAAEALKELLETLNPNETLVHIHGWIKALSPSIGKVLKESGFKSVMTLHDYFVACPNGGFFNYQAKSICHLQPMSLQCICTHCDSRNYSQKVWRVARQAVQSHFGYLPDGVSNFIAVTKFSERILRPFLPLHATVFNISNPVNNPFKNPRRSNIASRKLLFIGRLSPEKGIALACEAARLNNSFLTVIGDGELKSELELEYPEIQFKGWLKPEKVFEEMLEATALVFPSVLYETQGLSVLEAFSVGLPVIVSDKCAASELVNDKNGLLFESSNSKDLADKMNIMLTNLAATEERSLYIHDMYWKNPNTVEYYISTLLEAYKTILNKN